MVWDSFAVHMYICSFSFVFYHSYNHYTSLDSQRRMQYNDMKYVNVGNKVEVLTALTCNFQSIFQIGFSSVIQGAKFTKFGTHLVEGHLERTVSQIFYFGLGFHFMKCNKFSCKKMVNFPFFDIKQKLGPK